MQIKRGCMRIEFNSSDITNQGLTNKCPRKKGNHVYDFTLVRFDDGTQTRLVDGIE